MDSLTFAGAKAFRNENDALGRASGRNGVPRGGDYDATGSRAERGQGAETGCMYDNNYEHGCREIDFE